MKKLLAPSLLLIAAAFVPASFAAEPGWWTDMKRTCRAQGGTISEYYNSYTGCHLPSQLPRPSESQPPGPNLIRKDGRWSPEDGYDWVSAAAGDFRVRWVPNKRSNRHPNVITSENEGSWRPEDGYKFVNAESGDLRVVDDGRVDDAIRAAAVVVSLNEQKSRLEELSGLEHYDRVEAALKILVTRWVITMPLAQSRAQSGKS